MMKKYILGLFACLAMVAFVSCGDDDEATPIHHDTTPEIATAGIYSGTCFIEWSDKQGDHEANHAGTMTFSPTETAGISSLKIQCPEMSLVVDIVSVNVWYAGQGFQFSITSTASVNGTAQNLKIYGHSDDGITLSSAFVVNVKVGRSTTSYKYEFIGMKAVLD